MTNQPDWQTIAAAQRELFALSAHDFHGLVEGLRRAVGRAVDCDQGGFIFLIAEIVDAPGDPLDGRRPILLDDDDTVDFVSRLVAIPDVAYLDHPTSIEMARFDGSPRAILRFQPVNRPDPLSAYLAQAGLTDLIYGVIPTGIGTLEVAVSAQRREGLFGPLHKAQMQALIDGLQPVARRLALSYGNVPSQMLTPRERQTLSWLLRGLSEKQIAAELQLSRDTVHDYVRGVYRKLGVQSRAELMALWIEGNGL